MSATIAIIVGAALYLIGIVLGHGIDQEAAAGDSNPTQQHGEAVRLRPTSLVLTCLHAASGFVQTTTQANSRPGHCFFIVQATYGALVPSNPRRI